MTQFALEKPFVAGQLGLYSSWLWLSLPLAVGLAGFAVGGLAYSRHSFSAIPQVREEAALVYDGKPVPADPPYGLWLARWLPQAWQPHYQKELYELLRLRRGIWALSFLGMLACLAYGINSGEPVAVVPVLAGLALLWLATLPLRLPARAQGQRFLLTLPIDQRARWFGRTSATLFVALHFGCACTLAIAFRHGWQPAGLILSLMIATSGLSTLPRPAGS